MTSGTLATLAALALVTVLAERVDELRLAILGQLVAAGGAGGVEFEE